MKKILTVVFGLLVIVVVTPIAQLCTISVTNHDLETSSVSGWAYGGLFVMVLIAMVWRMISKRQGVARDQVVILFTMFALAVPVMNLGLARQLYTNLMSIPQHFIGYGVDGYSRAYQVQEPDWFPVVPVKEDLATLKSEKIFEFLRDDELLQQERAVLNDIWLDLQRVSRKLKQQQAVDADVQASFETRIDSLPVQAAEKVAGFVLRDPLLKSWMSEQGFQSLLESQIQKGLLVSDEAKREIEKRLGMLDEAVMYLLPVVQREKLDRSTLNRVNHWQTRMSEEEQQAFAEEVEKIEGALYRELQILSMSLHPMDMQSLMDQRSAMYLTEWEKLSSAELAAKRTDFIFRLGKQERKAILSREGRNLAGLLDGVYLENRDQTLLASQGLVANTRETVRRVPWGIWRKPLLHWGALFATFAGLMLYLAWILRKRWVERENLPFPLVEVADNLIRHDYLMESADDVCFPEPREKSFSPVFWAGFALGLLMILTDASSYYTIGEGAPLASNLSKTLFTSGALSSLTNIVFVLSPILLGIFFLLNLELSFSVWSFYMVFRVAFWMIGGATTIKDSNYVGFSAQNFPFTLEQLLGAGLCFSIILLIKAGIDVVKRRKQSQGDGKNSGKQLVLQSLGLMAFILTLYALCYDMGLTSPLLFSLFVGISLLLAIAVARMRAETGFPMYHSTYDFTRVPIVFGLTNHVDLRSMFSFFSLAFLPFTLLFRLLPQQIENFELGRRHRLSPRLLVVSGLLAVFTAIIVGLVSLLVISYWLGDVALGQGAASSEPGSFSVANYSSWVSHFRGENGVESFTVLHRTRLLFVGLGAALFGGLMLCRQRFLKFPFHPMGYLLLLFSMYHSWISPYPKGEGDISLAGTSWLWGSAFTAWILKKLLIKYGGIQSYRKAKPAAIGLIFGAVVTVLVINLIDLSFSHGGSQETDASSERGSLFHDKPAYTPEVY